MIFERLDDGLVLSGFLAAFPKFGVRFFGLLT